MKTIPWSSNITHDHCRKCKQRLPVFDTIIYRFTSWYWFENLNTNSFLSRNDSLRHRRRHIAASRGARLRRSILQNSGGHRKLSGPLLLVRFPDPLLVALLLPLLGGRHAGSSACDLLGLGHLVIEVRWGRETIYRDIQISLNRFDSFFIFKNSLDTFVKMITAEL